MEDKRHDSFQTGENRFVHLSLMRGFFPSSDQQLSTLAFKGYLQPDLFAIWRFWQVNAKVAVLLFLYPRYVCERALK
jgi:hypothetical protein